MCNNVIIFTDAFKSIMNKREPDGICLFDMWSEFFINLQNVVYQPFF